MSKIYPIGTKIKYISIGSSDDGKCGTIVGHRHCDCLRSINNICPDIYLPESSYVPSSSTPEKLITWRAGWYNLEVLPQKNKQLEFSFME